MDEDKAKEALKEALREWLDEKFATFGKWAMGAVAAAMLAAVVYFILAMKGWTPPR